MTEIFCAPLPERARIRLTGAEVVPFLNALLSRDVTPLAGGASPRVGLYAGLLTPQGKLVFAFLLVGRGGEGEVVIECDTAQREALLARLSLYRLRADVGMEMEEGGALVLWGGGVADSASLPGSAGVMFADPRNPSLGMRILPKAAAATGEGTADFARRYFPDARLSVAEEYRRHRLSLGVGEGGEELPAEEFFPWEVGMDLLNGLSLDKGCFIGQEVVSRVYRKGRVSRRLLPVRFASANGGGDPGDSVRLHDRSIGNLHFRRGSQGLALLRMDALADLSAVDELRIGEAAAFLLVPPWLRP